MSEEIRMKNPLAEKGILDCWNHVGVFGDRSCPELITAIHCKNCPVFTSAGRELLHREAPADYLTDWSERLAKPAVKQQSESVSVLIFRLFSAHLALDTKCFLEVTEPVVIHRIPHRSSPILLGIVNIRGEIQLCVSIGNLLSLKEASKEDSHQSSQKLAVIENQGERWAFLIDEVYGIHRIERAKFSAAKNSFTWDREEVLYEVLYIDKVSLFENLRKAMQ
jgi:Chemotaxis signal transduction protein